MKSIIFMGRTGVGKSSLSTMFYQGYISATANKFEISDSAIGCALDCSTSSNDYWKIYDTIGLGEAESGAVPHTEAKKRIIAFLKAIKTGFNYVCIVKKRGKLDTLDPIIYEATKEVFKGETLKNLVLVITDADNSWLTKERDTLKVVYGDIPIFAVDLPPVDPIYELEELYSSKRETSIKNFKSFLYGLDYPSRTSDLCQYSEREVESLGNRLLGIFAAAGATVLYLCSIQ